MEQAKLSGSPLEQGYRNTIYCSATLNQEDGKVTGTYCGNRWCMVCAGIRTAKAIERYMPVVKAWEGKHMVTLTLRNVPAAELQATLARMVADFQSIKLGMKRTDKVKLVALRKVECTYNARTDEYHPHFHIVVQGGEAARLLLARWLERHPDTATMAGQDVRACDDDSLFEVFKYFTKLLTKTRTKTAAGDQVSSAPMPPAALDIIFRAMKGRRVFQPVGFKVTAETDDESEELEDLEGTAATTRPGESIAWEWNQAQTDWVDAATGECLSGYEPGEKFRRLVEKMTAPPPAQLDALPASGPRLLESEQKFDPERARADMLRRLLELPADRERPMTAEFVTSTLQSVWGMSAQRAREMAPTVAPLPDVQFGLFGLLPMTRPKPRRVRAFSD